MKAIGAASLIGSGKVVFWKNPVVIHHYEGCMHGKRKGMTEGFRLHHFSTK